MSGAARPTLNGKGMSWQWDKTSHGGIVLTGYENSTWNDGIRQARLGDLVFCPKCKPHKHTISEVSGMNVHGVQSALEGDLTSCGAVLLAERASPQEIAAATAIMQGRGFDEALQFTNDQGQPLGRVYYKLYVGDELIYKGTTGEDGITARVFADTPMPITKAFIEPDTPFCCASSVQHAGEVTPLEIEPLAKPQTQA